MKNIKFSKMHSLGNDFVVIERLTQDLNLTPERIIQWAHRHRGVGFDQLLVLDPHSEAETFNYKIYNADGGEVMQCGNGARCIAYFAHEKGFTDRKEISLITSHDKYEVNLLSDNIVKVSLGIPQFNSVLNKINGHEFMAVSVGNPHAVLYVEQNKNFPLEKISPQIAKPELFAQGVNVGAAQKLSSQHIQLRVHERGAGETQACGSGACAAVVAGIVQGLLDNDVTVSLPGGDLSVQWQTQGKPVYLSGPVCHVYDGELTIKD